MALSVGTMMKSLDKVGIQYEWRQDGKLYAYTLQEGKDSLSPDWVIVPSDPDAFLEWLGY